jgi:cyclase
VLKKRVIPTLLYKDVGLVKGVGFDSWRRIGDARQSISLYNMREVDELIVLDITASRMGRSPDLALIDELADECFMPLTVGGGVRQVNDVRALLSVGADKVSINTGVIESPDLIRKAADEFGSQCIVVSIDWRSKNGGSAEVYSHAGSRPTGLDVVEWAVKAEQLGAGELLVTSIERDGTMSGYDLETIARICAAVSIPVIASGGAGQYRDLLDAHLAGAAAMAAASIFQFTEMTPGEAKNYLRARQVPVRV